jgi:hypothetical protein
VNAASIAAIPISVFPAPVTGEADGLAAGLEDCRFGHEVFLKHADEVVAPAD